MIVTSSDSARDRAEMEGLGANDYFRKPSEFPEFLKLGQRVRALLNLDPGPGQPAS
jgi:DNA-binding response OmpR family regulator